MAKTIQLSAELATKVGQLRAKIAALKEEEENLCGELKEAMAKEGIDEYAPKGSPYKLVYSESERPQVKWKEVAETFAKKLFGGKWRKELKKEADSYGTEPVCTLRVEPNEKYKPE